MRHAMILPAAALAATMAAAPALAGEPVVPIAPRGPDAPPTQYDPAVAPKRGAPAPLPADAAWLSRPSVEQTSMALQRLAPRWSGRASVRLDCAVGADGRLGACRVIASDAGDPGVDQAALLLAAKYARLNPVTAGGAALAGRRFTIVQTLVSE